VSLFKTKINITSGSLSFDANSEEQLIVIQHLQSIVTGTPGGGWRDASEKEVGEYT